MTVSPIEPLQDTLLTAPDGKRISSLMELCVAISEINEVAIPTIEAELSAVSALPLELGDLFEDLANSYLKLADNVRMLG